MIVPQYWSEGRAQFRERGRQITVRRFGWSDESQADADVMAQQRSEQALHRLVAGEKLIKREPKIPYNGAAGVPIREEIVARHGELVITRNAYGARCLNTANVLFADIDLPNEASFRFTVALVFCYLLLAFLVALAIHSLAMGLILGGLAVLIGGATANRLFFIWMKIRGGAERQARARLNKFVGSHGDWSLRLYRTPAGFRVLVTHKTFSPIDPAVTEFFDQLLVDPVYQQMCRNQQCFRARLSAKPWRIGLAAHLKPRPGVWPVRAEQMGRRRAWIDRYEAVAQGYAACEFIEAIGPTQVHADVQAVLQLHDQLSGALSGKPLA